MSTDNAPLIREARAFLDELFTQGIPLQSLLNTGAFAGDWPARYLAFVERVAQHYGESAPMPREVVAAIYSASVYCTKRYQDWQHFTGGSNDATEAVVNNVRWAGDRLILSPYWRV